jgi:hypothetical protein
MLHNTQFSPRLAKVYNDGSLSRNRPSLRLTLFNLEFILQFNHLHSELNDPY